MDNITSKNKIINEILNLIEKGENLFNENNFSCSSQAFLKALDKSLKTKYVLGSAKCYSKLGIIEYNLSNFHSSLEYALNALKLYEELNDSENVALQYKNIGAVYAFQDDLEKALEFFTKSKEISASLNYDHILCQALNNCGVIYLKLGDLTKALEHYEEALKLSRESGEKITISNALCNIGIVHMENKEYEKALPYFKEALKIQQEENSQYGIAFMNFRISEAFFWLNDNSIALEYLDKSINIAKEIKNTVLQSYCYMLYSNIYENMEDCKTALKYYKCYTDVREKIINEDRNNKVAELQTKYELYKKEKEMEIYKLKNIKLKKLNMKLKEAYLEADKLSKIDFLTETYNRRNILDMLNDMFINKNEETFSVILCDIDDFKKINDTYGHNSGDYILVEVSHIIIDNIPKHCKVARWGGEEFLLVLPGYSLKQSLVLGEKIRKAIVDKNFIYNNNKIKVSLTQGVYEYTDQNEIDIIIKKADEALYKGKNSGKNCVVAAV